MTSSPDNRETPRPEASLVPAPSSRSAPTAQGQCPPPASPPPPGARKHPTGLPEGEAAKNGRNGCPSSEAASSRWPMPPWLSPPGRKLPYWRALNRVNIQAGEHLGSPQNHQTGQSDNFLGRLL